MKPHHLLLIDLFLRGVQMRYRQTDGRILLLSRHRNPQALLHENFSLY